MLSVIITKAVAMTVAVMPAGEVTPIAAVAWFMAIISYCSAPITDSLIQVWPAPAKASLCLCYDNGNRRHYRKYGAAENGFAHHLFFIPICLARLTALNKNINDIAKMAVTIKPPSKNHPFVFVHLNLRFNTVCVNGIIIL